MIKIGGDLLRGGGWFHRFCHKPDTFCCQFYLTACLDYLYQSQSQHSVINSIYISLGFLKHSFNRMSVHSAVDQHGHLTRKGGSSSPSSELSLVASVR